jgi:hypothetical protein
LSSYSPVRPGWAAVGEDPARILHIETQLNDEQKSNVAKSYEESDFQFSARKMREIPSHEVAEKIPRKREGRRGLSQVGPGPRKLVTLDSTPYPRG